MARPPSPRTHDHDRLRLPPAPPPRSGEAGGKGVGEHRHERMAVQAGPRSPLEGAEPQLLFQLLVRLLADPACLDGCGQAPQRGARREIAEVVFALAAAAPFADEPDLFAGQMAVSRAAWSVSDAHAQGEIEAALSMLP